MKFYVIPLYNSWKISKILQGNTFWRARYVDQIGLAENLAEGKGHCVQAPPQMLISTADGRGGGKILSSASAGWMLILLPESTRTGLDASSPVAH